MFSVASLPVNIISPRIPFIKGVTPANGLIFSIQGYVQPYAVRFSFNLHLGGCNGNYALHIDHRFDELCIVRNTSRYNAWEQEERHGCMPLRHGEHFTLKVLIEDSRFLIAYNDIHFFNLK